MTRARSSARLKSATSATREDAFCRREGARLVRRRRGRSSGRRALQLGDAQAGSIAESPREEAASDAASASADAGRSYGGSGFGLVEKIDFDNLTFETDDE